MRVTQYRQKPFPLFAHYARDREEMAQLLLSEFFRRNPGKTHAQYAEMAHVGVSTIQNLMYGRTRFPRTDTIWKLASVVGYRLELVEHRRARKRGAR